MAETPGYGTTIGYCLTQAGTYTSIAEVVDIKPPAVEIADVKTSHFLSANQANEYQPGWKEGGELEITIHWDKTLYNTLYGTLLGNMYWFKTTFADNVATASTSVFNGYIKKVGPEIPLDDIVTVALTMKVSGLPVFTPGT